MFEELTARSVADDSALVHPIEDLVELVWPTFIREGAPYREARYHGDYPGLYRRWPEYQYAFLNPDGVVVAAVHCCPMAWDGDEGELPDDGWDWELESAAEDLAAGRKPRTLGAVSITVHPDLRGQQLSPHLLRHMHKLAKGAGLRRLIAPVRPTQKSQQPFLPIEEYIALTTSEGLSVDAWLRTHQRLEARIIKACRRSMQLEGKVQDWRSWTGAELATSGDHAFAGGLAPLHVDLEADRCIYIEPNVWMVHDIPQ